MDILFTWTRQDMGACHLEAPYSGLQEEERQWLWTEGDSIGYYQDGIGYYQAGSH